MGLIVEGENFDRKGGGSVVSPYIRIDYKSVHFDVEREIFQFSVKYYLNQDKRKLEKLPVSDPSHKSDVSVCLQELPTFIQLHDPKNGLIVRDSSGAVIENKVFDNLKENNYFGALYQCLKDFLKNRAGVAQDKFLDTL